MLHRALIGMLLSTIGLAPAAVPQIRASERGLVSQTIDGTTITINYGRPQVRGREVLYGGEIPWGKVWTPGANWATTLESDKDITIDGHRLAAGKYSVWLQVQPDGWTAIFDPQPRRFHLMPPPVADNQVRFTVTPQDAAAEEMLTWSFSEVRPTGATLSMHWGPKAVSFHVGVQPSRDLTVTEAAAAPYVGSYIMHQEAPLGGGDMRFDVRWENARLVANWESPPSPRLLEFWLIPLGSGVFAAGELDHGELFDIMMDLTFEFAEKNGHATGFELRAIDDSLWGTGERR